MTILEFNLRQQAILERRAVYEISQMPPEAGMEYLKRLKRNRDDLESKKAAHHWNDVTAQKTHLM